MTHHEKSAASTSDRTVAVSRTFDAPRETVFKWFTQPELIAQWYAPEPLSVPKAEMDVRPGGKYTIVMRDEEGNDYPGGGVYKEVVPPERLVYTDSVEWMPPAWVDMLNEARGAEKGTPVADGIVTVTFEDVGGKTKVTFADVYDTKATRDAYVKMQMIEGLEAGFDNLAKLLAQQPSMA